MNRFFREGTNTSVSEIVGVVVCLMFVSAILLGIVAIWAESWKIGATALLVGLVTPFFAIMFESYEYKRAKEWK